MTRLEVLQPFIERTVGQYLGTTDVHVWEDGTIPIRSGSTIVNLRLVEGEDGSHPILQVSCPMLSEIDASPELLSKLNEVNADLTFVRAFWAVARSSWRWSCWPRASIGTRWPTP